MQSLSIRLSLNGDLSKRRTMLVTTLDILKKGEERRETEPSYIKPFLERLGLRLRVYWDGPIGRVADACAPSCRKAAESRTVIMLYNYCGALMGAWVPHIIQSIRSVCNRIVMSLMKPEAAPDMGGTRVGPICSTKIIPGGVSLGVLAEVIQEPG
jgi:hypothetical protein